MSLAVSGGGKMGPAPGVKRSASLAKVAAKSGAGVPEAAVARAPRARAPSAARGLRKVTCRGARRLPELPRLRTYSPTNKVSVARLCLCTS